MNTTELQPPSAAPSVTSRSHFLRLRGLLHHIREWGDPAKPIVLLGHGWLDVSATFQDLVQPLLGEWRVVAPDWRGFGHSQWPLDGYWFPDYVADLDGLVQHFSPEAPLVLVGHSMGAQIMSLYAGMRPQKVSRLVCLDGLFLPDMEARLAPKHLRRWVDIWPGKPPTRTYPSFEFLAERVRVQHPQLTPERALFIARCWGAEDAYGRIRLLADPKHHLPMPHLYRAAESKEIWRQVTAPTLFIDAGKSNLAQALTAEEHADRRACFRDGRSVTLADAGHMLHFDAPLETGRLIAGFLRSGPATVEAPRFT
ncbi:MAG TPA: alpha/beta hydrolase [Fontimonas sp.]